MIGLPLSWESNQPTPSQGIVHMVGAGPGRQGWLTLDAINLLRQAHLIAYDDLIHPNLLEYAAPDAELLAVGYRAYQHRLQNQPSPVHPLVLEYAKQGKRVVRLKSGDPMLYGRTWEEISMLVEHDISWSIIPGITVAFGAAASVPIPLTHRGLSAGVRVMAGNHSNPSHDQRETIVVYMPRCKIRQLCARLMTEGRPAEQGAAYIQAVGSALQTVVYGTLQTLPDLVDLQSTDLPGLVIIGDVVKLAGPQRASGWKPLANKRVLLLRASDLQSPLVETLQSWGADLIQFPYLRRLPMLAAAQIIDFLQSLDEASVMLISSEFSVSLIRAAMKQTGIDQRTLPRFPILTVGSACQQALRAMGWLETYHWPVIPTHLDSQSLPDELRNAGEWHYFGEQVSSKRLRLLWSEKNTSSPINIHLAYRLQYQALRINSPEPDLVIIPNRRAAKLLFEQENSFCLTKPYYAVMGERTLEILGEHDISKVICAASSDYPSLLETIEQWSRNSLQHDSLSRTDSERQI